MELSQPLIKILKALQERGAPMDNKELKAAGVGTLTGDGRETLNDQGLVTSEKVRSAFVHTLTQAGRDFLATPPKPVVKKPAPKPKLPPVGLSPNQILAVIVLMAEARELTNTEFAAIAGFPLNGRDNTALVKRGLVETDKNARPMVHQLTDAGWSLARTLHETEPPKEGRSAIQTLFTLMANVGRALERLQLSHGEFFKQTQTTTVDAAPAPVAIGPEGVEGAIRAAYTALADPPGDWVGLADVRDRLPGVEKAAVDNALRAMLSQPGVRVIPVANLKSLDARDRAAAVRIGGEDSHMMAIESS
ncbi:hypothetical protein [Dactylosporangium sp. NPDC051541]|uniref:hypothetical protein n=1 Tax=Dactylosporangium sp. NPDC051541 TaxID=3363977 RepID=UPI0037A58263